MRWRPALATLGAALALGAGCSSGGGGPPDDDGAADDGAADGDDVADGCDEIEQAEEGGEVVIGTGYAAFEALAEDIRIIAGPQGGFHLNLNARIEGLDRGNPDDLLDPDNPTTAFGIYTPGERVRLDVAACPVRVGYRPDGDRGVLPLGVSVIFDVEDVAELVPLYDGPVLIRVEVVDAGGRHSADERTIVVREPLPPD